MSECCSIEIRCFFDESVILYTFKMAFLCGGPKESGRRRRGRRAREGDLRELNPLRVGALLWLSTSSRSDSDTTGHRSRGKSTQTNALEDVLEDVGLWGSHCPLTSTVCRLVFLTSVRLDWSGRGTRRLQRFWKWCLWTDKNGLRWTSKESSARRVASPTSCVSERERDRERTREGESEKVWPKR